MRLSALFTFCSSIQNSGRDWTTSCVTLSCGSFHFQSYMRSRRISSTSSLLRMEAANQNTGGYEFKTANKLFEPTREDARASWAKSGSTRKRDWRGT